MIAGILCGWDPQQVEDEARRLRGVFKYAKSAPADPLLREREYWHGPKDYGCVNPV